MDRRSFWPLVVLGMALAAAAASLFTLAAEKPAASLPNPVAGVSAACLVAISLFQESGNRWDPSDLPLLLGAGAAAIGCVAALVLAKARR
jgi:hypothetical protein